MSADSTKKEIYNESSCSGEEDSDTDEYISEEKLVVKLEEIIQRVKKGTYEKYVLQDIFDSVEEYLHEKKIHDEDISKEAIGYLFRGFWLTNTMKNVFPNSTAEFPHFDVCPFCLKENKEKSEKINTH